MAADSCGAAAPVHISSTVSVVIFRWIPTADGDTLSCLGGGDDTAWLFGSEYSVSQWDETARGLHARSYMLDFILFRDDAFRDYTVPRLAIGF